MSLPSLQKNIKAFSLGLIFTSAAAQGAEPPLPVISNFFTGTSSQENFSAQGTKNGIDYSSSSAVMSLTLKDGSGTNTGAGGNAQGDAIDSSIQNIIGSNSASNLGYNILVGNASANALYGTGSSKNTLDGGAGADTLVGSPNGWNWARYTSSPAAIYIDLGKGTGSGGDAEGDRLYNIDAVDGSKYADTLIGTSNQETLRGNAGNNYMDPKEGDDTCIGGVDSDTYVYTGGTVTFQESTTGTTGHKDTVIFASKWSPSQASFAGNKLTFDAKNSIAFNDINLIEKFSFSGYPSMTLDQLKTSNGTIPNPLYENSQAATSATENFKGAVGDTVDYTFSTSPVTVTLDGDVAGSGGYASNDTYDSGVMNIIGADTLGSAGYNKLTGDENPNRIYGLGSSKNYLDGRGGADMLIGSPNGWNWVIYTSSPEAVTVNLATNVNTGGHAQGDLLYNIDAVKGSSYDDDFTGDAFDNTFDGSTGTDAVHFKGKFSEYTITSSNSGLTVKDNTASRDGTDTFTNTEKFVFSDGTYVSGVFTPTQNVFVAVATLQAANTAGYSNPSEEVILPYKSGPAALKLSFTAPLKLVNEHCISENPVTNYRLNTFTLDSNNAVLQTNAYEFGVTDPNLYCHDNVNKYNEDCGVFEQECDMPVQVNLP